MSQEVTRHACLFYRQIRCYCVTPDQDLAQALQDMWTPDSAVWTHFKNPTAAMEVLLTDPPDMLVVDDRMEAMDAAGMIALVKGENVYRQLPVIVCVEAARLSDGVNWNSMEADDFLLLPLDPPAARARLDLAMCRAARSLDANPLTRLPGNTSIIQRIQELIDAGEEFALCYVDLDHFKSFNDKYGFSRGDEALLMTARILVNTVRAMRAAYSFVGHVGGDDFVFILPPDVVETACERVVKSFDSIVPNFYDSEDRKNGAIYSTDRQGMMRTFPIMSLSIAVVINHDGKLKHFGEASHIASGLKKKAKENPKSCYVVDRRKR